MQLRDARPFAGDAPRRADAFDGRGRHALVRRGDESMRDSPPSALTIPAKTDPLTLSRLYRPSRLCLAILAPTTMRLIWSRQHQSSSSRVVICARIHGFHFAKKGLRDCPLAARAELSR
eukprot:6193171-Pleurochrysis_carterae.AAC.1